MPDESLKRVCDLSHGPSIKRALEEFSAKDFQNLILIIYNAKYNCLLIDFLEHIWEWCSQAAPSLTLCSIVMLEILEETLLLMSDISSNDGSSSDV